MKNTVCIFFSNTKIEKTLPIYGDLIESLPAEYEKFYFVNFYKIINKKKQIVFDHHKYEKKYNIKIICPNNITEFKEFIENRFIFAFDSLGKTLEFFKTRFLINKKNIKLLQLQNAGCFSNQNTFNAIMFEKNISKKNLFYLLKKIFIRKVVRLLVFFKIFSPIFIYFECRNDIVENCLKYERKIGKKTKIFNYLYFQNTIKINSRSYDKSLKNVHETSEDKIIFIDGNYKHGDVLYRENIDLEKIKKRYFEKLNLFLNNISGTLNKEVIVCLHPSSDLEEYKSLLKGFKLNQLNTEKNIYSAFIVIFHESSSIDTAIFLKKRIISLQTGLFGKYLLNRIKKYGEMLGLLSIDLNNSYEFDKKFIEEKTKIDEKKYNDYINSYLKADGNELVSTKIYKTLNFYFNLINKIDEK